MSLTLNTGLGHTEVVIDPQGNLHRFYQIAGLLTDYFQVTFVHKEDDFDAINWHFTLGKYHLTLQYNIYNGIMLFPTKEEAARRRDNRAVKELANVLAGKLMTLDRNAQTQPRS